MRSSYARAIVILALASLTAVGSVASAQEAERPAGWWQPAGPPIELAGRELFATLVGSSGDGTLELATGAGLWRGVPGAWRRAGASPSFLPQAVVRSPAQPELALAVANLVVFLSPRFSIPEVITGFVERSGDGGRTFERCLPEPPLPLGSGGVLGENRAIAAVAFDPSEPARAYLATGDGLLRLEVTSCDQLEEVDPQPLLDLITLDGRSGTVLVAASRESPSVLLRSPAGELSWTRALPSGAPATSRWALAADPLSGAAWALSGQDDGDLVLWASARDGRSWRRRSDLPLSGAPHQLAVGTSGSLFAVFGPLGDPQQGARLLRSLDGGRSWVEVTPRLLPEPARVEVHARGISWTAGGRLFESSDAGESWSEAPTPVAPEGHRLIASNDQLVLLDTDPPFPGQEAAPLASPDGGSSWSEVDPSLPPGVSVLDIRTLRRSPSSGAVYAVSSSSEVALLASEDGGSSWSAADGGGLPSLGRVDVVRGGASRADDELLYVATALAAERADGLGIVQRSENGGESWTEVGPAAISLLDDIDVAVFGETAVVAVVGSGFLAPIPTRSDQLQVSLDGGATFPLSLGGPPGVGARRWIRVVGLEAGGSGSPVPELLLGTAGGVFSSDDLGTSWAPAELHPAAYGSLAPVADPDDSRRLYLATDRAGVFESLDAGRSWRPLPGLAAGLPIRALELDAETRTLWASTAAGLFARVRPRLGDCTASPSAHCLAGGRFLVEARFRRDTAAADESAQAFEITGDTGAFWFFDPTNLELVVKVLDGCAINDSWWVFATGLTDVEVELVVTDSTTGTERRVESAPGKPFRPVFDLSAFPCP